MIQNQDVEDDLRAVHGEDVMSHSNPLASSADGASPKKKRKASLTMEEMEAEAATYLDKQRAAAEKREKIMKICGCIWPVICLVLCFVTMGVSASVSSHKGNYSYTFIANATLGTTNTTTYNGAFSDYCSDFVDAVDRENLTPTPVVGQCKAYSISVAGAVMGVFFTVISIPPCEKLGKCMQWWSVCVFLSSVLVCTGFVISFRVPYFYGDENDQEQVKYNSDKLWDCSGTGAYCYTGEFKDEYRTMQGFTFMTQCALFVQGARVWSMRKNYIEYEQLPLGTFKKGGKDMEAVGDV